MWNIRPKLKYTVLIVELIILQKFSERKDSHTFILFLYEKFH